MNKETNESLVIARGEFVCVQSDAVWCESAGDFTLPEYMPEIGKMLKVEPRIIPSGKYIGSDRAEFSGSIVYSVLYTGEDGVPFYTTLSGDYEYAVALGSAADCQEIEIYDEPALESVSVRPSGPRKLSVRTRIRSIPRIMYRAPSEEDSVSGMHEAQLEKLCHTQQVMSYRHFESGEFEIGEVFRLDASAEAQVVGCDGKVAVTEVVSGLEGVTCRGEAECRILYFDIEGGRRHLCSSVKKMRFERTIPLSEYVDACGVRAYGRLVSADVSVSDVSDEITLNAVVNLCGEYVYERKSSFLCDAYSTSGRCDVAYRDVEYRRNVLCKNLNFSYHSQKDLPDDMKGSVTVSTCSASARVEGCEVNDGHVRIAGEISIDCVLLCNDDGVTEYSLFTIPVPFRCETPADNVSDGYELHVAADVTGVRARAEKNGVSADAELYLAVFAQGIEHINTVSGLELGPDEQSLAADRVTVYYPDSGETLWSVGKKYSVSISSLQEANGITASSYNSPDSLYGVKSLLIL